MIPYYGSNNLYMKKSYQIIITDRQNISLRVKNNQENINRLSVFYII